MNHNLEFKTLVRYDSGRSGITVKVELRLGDDSVTLDAKIDSGSTYCVFERRHGERLGIEIEKGLSERIGTASGSFQAFAH